MNNTEVIEATIIITAIRFQCPVGVIGMIMHLRPTAIRMGRIVIRARPLIMGILTMHLCANDPYSKKPGLSPVFIVWMNGGYFDCIKNSEDTQPRLPTGSSISQ